MLHSAICQGPAGKGSIDMPGCRLHAGMETETLVIIGDISPRYLKLSTADAIEELVPHMQEVF